MRLFVSKPSSKNRFEWLSVDTVLRCSMDNDCVDPLKNHMIMNAVITRSDVKTDVSI